MKPKRIIAAMAAAAAMLGGLAFGTATANAAPAGQSIEITNSQPGHTYSAYRFAAFSNPTAGDTAGQAGSVEVSTTATGGFLNAVTTAAKTAKNNATEVPNPYKNNVAAWIATFSDSELRTFADNLTTPPTGDADGSVEGGSEGEASTVSISGLEDNAWYIVFDTATGKTPVAIAGPTGVIATQLKSGEATYTKIAGKNGAADIVTLGQMNAKSENPTISKGVDTKPVNIGEEKTFTLTANAPKESLDSYPMYTLTFTDTPGTGLTVYKKDDSKLNLTINGKTINDIISNAQYEGASVTVNGLDTELAGDGTKSFSVVLNKQAVQYLATVTGDKDVYKGKIVLSYTGYINESAPKDGVTNKATVNPNGTTDIDSNIVTVKVGTFEFTKIGVEEADSKGLDGAEFNVYKGKDIDPTKATPLKFKLVGGVYVYAKDQTDDEANATLKSGDIGAKKGVVSVRGLAAGDYTVVETKAPTGYASNFTVTFNVSINDKGEATFEQDGLHQVTPGSNGAATTVLNVKSVTQLPLTGAAGTALFTIIGVLLAGAALVVFMKSRSGRRMPIA